MCVSLRVYVLMPLLQTTLWKIIARGVSFAVTALEKETKEGKIYFSIFFFLSLPTGCPVQRRGETFEKIAL